MLNTAIPATATGLPKLTRRSLLAAAATTPLVALPVAASAFDKTDTTDLILAIGHHTGLSLNDLAHWFKGIDPDTIGQIMFNILKAPIKIWSYEQTRSAVTAVKTGEIFKDRMRAENPTLPHTLRQIALRGDRAAMKNNLAYFKGIDDHDGLLMEYA